MLDSAVIFFGVFLLKLFEHKMQVQELILISDEYLFLLAEGNRSCNFFDKPNFMEFLNSSKYLICLIF